MTLLQTSWDRPPEGLARGRFAAPAWLVALLGVAVFVGAIAWLVVRARRGGRRA